MRHTRAQTPAHLVWVEQRPSSSHSGKAAYFDAVKAAAAAEVGTPIAANDIEVEIVYSTIRMPDKRLDVYRNYRDRFIFRMFAFHDQDEIATKMLARIAKRTGIAPKNL